ncbi:hypothetical protein DMENIID0001_066090 [Sergentomyia squamirostris]
MKKIYLSRSFIRVLKDKPIIWDRDYDCPCFSSDRNEAYRNLARRFEISEDRLRTRIKTLKIQYAAERSRKRGLRQETSWPVLKLTFLENNFEKNGGNTQHKPFCEHYLNEDHEDEDKSQILESSVEVFKVEVTDEPDPNAEIQGPLESSSSQDAAETNPSIPLNMNSIETPADKKSMDLFFDFLHKSFEERNISHEQFMEFAGYCIKFLKEVSTSKST